MPFGEFIGMSRIRHKPVKTLATFASIARIHIVAIGALGTLTFGFALCGTRPWALALLCASDWFVVNLLNRVVDLKEDAANNIRGTDLVARNKRVVLVIGFGVLGGCVLLPPRAGVRSALRPARRRRRPRRRRPHVARSLRRPRRLEDRDGVDA